MLVAPTLLGLVVSIQGPAQPAAPVAARDEPFTLDQVLGSPFPSSLVAAPRGSTVAWSFQQRGRSSVLVAEGPDFDARSVAEFAEDDGRSVSIQGFSASGRFLVFTHGGSADPVASPDGPAPTRCLVLELSSGRQHELPARGGLALSPSEDRVAYVEGDTVMSCALTPEAQPQRIHRVRGRARELQWSPDGQRLCLSLARTSFDVDYGFVAWIDVAGRELHYVDPGVDTDASPRWSPDGRQIAFRRRLTPGGPFVLTARHFPQPDPWQLRVHDLETGDTHDVLREPDPGAWSWTSFRWLDDQNLVFTSERDGWRRLYRVRAGGGRARAISEAGAEVDDYLVLPDRSGVVHVSNAGDLDRRHLHLRATRGPSRALTAGETLEWSPVVTADGTHIVHLGSSGRHPAHVWARPLDASADQPSRKLAPDRLPADFPLDHLCEPRAVVLRAADGTAVHAQRFDPPEHFTGPRPAVLFFHGGPIRQMLLGWHHRGYYHHCYAMNQTLASRGYVVLSVNYRLGVGYGAAFRDVPDGGPRGASEYQDVLAAAKWLRRQPQVDPDRIGLWGGSYGGLLTALGLARNSDLFAAGVDLHGVHDWNAWQSWTTGADERMEEDRAAWVSSSMASIDSWRSPVLLVHGDDDRNVPFSETIHLVRALRERGVEHELMVVPDDVHSFLLWRNWRDVLHRSVDFLDRKLRDRATPLQPIRPGSARYEFSLPQENLEVFTHKPGSYDGQRMIFVLHGTLRNADEYRDHAVAMAERFGALVVAPRFDAERFPVSKYQYGGILDPDGEAAAPEDWTYARIPQLAEQIRRMEDRPELPYWIIGHSAGGQFVARMSAFQPTGAVGHVAANPGSHLFPTRELPFGYGFGELPPALSDDAALRRYLAVPLTIYLGTADDHPDRYFDQSDSAMSQGNGRWQRGRKCYDLARALAAERGWDFAWRLVEAEGVGHDHTRMFDAPACAEAFGFR